MQPRVSVADLVAKKLEPTPDMVSQQLQDVRSQQQLQRLESIESSFVSAIQHLIKYLDGKTTKTEVVNQLQSIGTPDMLKVVSAIEQLDKDVLASKLDIAPLKEGLAALEAQLKQIPKALPTAQKSLEVSNFSDIGKEFDQAIQKLKLEAPKVNVNVKEPNLLPIQVIFKDLLLAVRNIKLPEAKPTDVSGVEKRLDDVVSVTSGQEKYHKEANKLLKDIANRPMGGGGSRGSGTSYKDTAGNLVFVALDANGNIPTIQKSGLLPFAYDYKAQTQNSTQDIWTYKSGGAGGTLVATKTITYVDSTKSVISTIVRT